MDIFAFDASLYGVAGVTPAKNSFKLALDGRTYNAMRSVTFPDHKVERTVITSAGLEAPTNCWMARKINWCSWR